MLLNENHAIHYYKKFLPLDLDFTVVTRSLRSNEQTPPRDEERAVRSLLVGKVLARLKALQRSEFVQQV